MRYCWLTITLECFFVCSNTSPSRFSFRLLAHKLKNKSEHRADNVGIRFNTHFFFFRCLLVLFHFSNESKGIGSFQHGRGFDWFCHSLFSFQCFSACGNTHFLKTARISTLFQRDFLIVAKFILIVPIVIFEFLHVLLVIPPLMMLRKIVMRILFLPLFLVFLSI